MSRYKHSAFCVSLIAASAILSGCNSERSDGSGLVAPDVLNPPPPVAEFPLFVSDDYTADPDVALLSRAGVYSVFAIGSASPVTSDAVAVVSNSGRVTVIEGDGLVFGRTEVDDGGFLFTEGMRVDFGSQAAAEAVTFRLRPDFVTGSAPAESLLLNVTDTAGDQINRRLGLQVGRSAVAAFSDIEGEYRFEGDGFVSTWVVSDAGVISGGDTTGCSFAGTVHLLNAGTEVLEYDVEKSFCGALAGLTGAERDGRYSGLGYYDEFTFTLNATLASDQVASRFMGVSENAVEPPPEVDPTAFISADRTPNDGVVSLYSPGVYEYELLSLTDDPLVDPERGIALLSPSGRFVILSEDRRGYSRLTVSETGRLVGAYDQINLDSSVPPASNIRIVQEASGSSARLLVSLENDAEELVARLVLDRDPLLSDSVYSFSDAGRVFVESRPGEIVINLDIDASPDNEVPVTGSDTTGCVLSGDALNFYGGLSLLEVRLSAASCGGLVSVPAETRNGDYHGVGFMVPLGGDFYGLVLFIVNESGFSDLITDGFEPFGP